VLAVLLIAYPPAHGADSSDYFLYAAQFEGLDVPVDLPVVSSADLSHALCAGQRVGLDRCVGCVGSRW
jgi:hypothetical protein